MILSLFGIKGTLWFISNDGAIFTNIWFLNISVSQNTIPRNVRISPSTIHNIIKWFRESREQKSVHPIIKTCRGYPETLSQLPETPATYLSLSLSEMDWLKVETCAMFWQVYVSHCFWKSWTLNPPGKKWKGPSRLHKTQSNAKICEGLGCVSPHYESQNTAREHACRH